MDLTNRAKIFSPYDALRGFDEAIEDTEEKVQRVRKVLLSEEEKAVLSDKLLHLQKGMPLCVTYFKADPDGLGRYLTACGTLKKLDAAGQKMEIEEGEPDRTAGKLEKILPTVIRFADLLSIRTEQSVIHNTEE